MNTKLQELTNKLYHEGIEKAQAESERLLEDAKKESKEIIEAAKKEKEQILIDAEKEAGNFKKNVLSELKMASRQMLGSLKNRISEMVIEKSISEPIKNGLKDDELLRNLLEKTVTAIKMDGSSIEIKLNDKDKSLIEEVVKSGKSAVLNEGIDLIGDPNIENGFKLKPSSGNYLISFTDQDFIRFFSKFMREQTVKFIDDDGSELEIRNE